MKPLSNRYFSCSFSSFNSAGAIMYGEIDIGQVSGMTSMPKSISLLRGTLGRSSWKTYRNLLTIGTYLREGTSALESLTQIKR